MKIMIIL